LPLLGWSYYSLEESLTTCSVEWRDKALDVVSYNVAIFIFVFFIPLILIIVTNAKLVFVVRKKKADL
jgi:hypothetical protein